MLNRPWEGLGSIIQNTTRGQEKAVEEAREPKVKSVPEKKIESKIAKQPKPKPENVPSSERGCLDGETRKTFILKKELAGKNDGYCLLGAR